MKMHYMKKKLLIIDKFDKNTLEKTKKIINVTYKPNISITNLKKIINLYDFLFISTRIPITEDLINNADNLKLIIRMGIGVDHIDLNACKNKKIVLCNTPKSNISPVVEYVFGQLLRYYKNFNKMQENILNGNFRDGLQSGEELSNKTIGIIGVGKIGSKVAKTASCFGMKVIGNDPYLSRKKKKKLPVDKWLKKKDLLKISDIVTLHVPLTDKTQYLVNKNFLNSMKKGSILINTSRGKVLKFDDVLNNIQNNKIKKYILDVFENEPFKPEIKKEYLDYFYFSPHTAAYTNESMYKRSKEAFKQLQDFLNNKKPHGIIDYKKGY